MNLKVRSRPSPALLVAAIAMTFALVGTSVATDRGEKLTKKSVKKVANKQITKRAPGLSVDKAKTATHATTAANANALGGAPPAAYATAASEPYHDVGAPGEPAFGTGWSSFEPASFSPVAFYKDSQGLVHLKGILSGPSGTVAFTLPPGYRPASTLLMPVAVGGSIAGHLTVRADGGVVPTADGGGTISAGIAGLSFRAGS